MWNTQRVGVTADNIVWYKASSLTVLGHSLATRFTTPIWVFSGELEKVVFVCQIFEYRCYKSFSSRWNRASYPSCPLTGVVPNFILSTWIFTARKRSFGQGNSFRSVCHSVLGDLCMMSFLVWPHVPSGGSLFGRGVSVRKTPWEQTPHAVESGRYASYWNAFLFSVVSASIGINNKGFRNQA